MDQAVQLAGSDQASKAPAPQLWEDAARLHLRLRPLLLPGASPLAIQEHALPRRGARGEVRSSLWSAKRNCQGWEKGLLSQHRGTKGKGIALSSRPA